MARYIPPEQTRITYQVDVRYRGQGLRLTIAADPEEVRAYVQNVATHVEAIQR